MEELDDNELSIISTSSLRHVLKKNQDLETQLRLAVQEREELALTHDRTVTELTMALAHLGLRKYNGSDAARECACGLRVTATARELEEARDSNRDLERRLLDAEHAKSDLVARLQDMERDVQDARSALQQARDTHKDHMRRLDDIALSMDRLKRTAAQLQDKVDNVTASC